MVIDIGRGVGQTGLKLTAPKKTRRTSTAGIKLVPAVPSTMERFAAGTGGINFGEAVT